MCLCDRLALLNSKIQKCLDRHIQHDWSLFNIGNFLPPEQWHIEPIDRNSVIGNDSRRFSRKKTDKGVQKSCLASSILAVQTINSSSIKCNAAMIQEHMSYVVVGPLVDIVLPKLLQSNLGLIINVVGTQALEYRLVFCGAGVLCVLITCCVAANTNFRKL